MVFFAKYRGKKNHGAGLFAVLRSRHTSTLASHKSTVVWAALRGTCYYPMAQPRYPSCFYAYAFQGPGSAIAFFLISSYNLSIMRTIARPSPIKSVGVSGVASKSPQSYIGRYARPTPLCRHRPISQNNKPRRGEMFIALPIAQYAIQPRRGGMFIKIPHPIVYRVGVALKYSIGLKVRNEI